MKTGRVDSDEWHSTVEVIIGPGDLLVTYRRASKRQDDLAARAAVANCKYGVSITAARWQASANERC